jgi:hypothetical protein
MATNNANNFFSPLAVENGGIGSTPLTPNAPIIGGPGPYNDMQSVGAGFFPSGLQLCSTGTSSAPVWTVAGSSIILLNTQTVTSPVTQITLTGLSASFENYLVVFNNLYSATPPSTNDFYLSVGGTTVINGYAGILTSFIGSASRSVNSTAPASIPYLFASSTNYINGYMFVLSLNTYACFMGQIDGYAITGPVGKTGELYGYANYPGSGSGQIDSIVFRANPDTFDSGSVSLYGIKS